MYLHMFSINGYSSMITQFTIYPITQIQCTMYNLHCTLYIVHSKYVTPIIYNVREHVGKTFIISANIIIIVINWCSICIHTRTHAHTRTHEGMGILYFLHS